MIILVHFIMLVHIALFPDPCPVSIACSTDSFYHPSYCHSWDRILWALPALLCTASDRKPGMGPGNEARSVLVDCMWTSSWYTQMDTNDLLHMLVTLVTYWRCSKTLCSFMWCTFHTVFVFCTSIHERLVHSDIISSPQMLGSLGCV